MEWSQKGVDISTNIKWQRLGGSNPSKPSNYVSDGPILHTKTRPTLIQSSSPPSQIQRLRLSQCCMLCISSARPPARFPASPSPPSSQPPPLCSPTQPPPLTSPPPAAASQFSATAPQFAAASKRPAPNRDARRPRATRRLACRPWVTRHPARRPRGEDLQAGHERGGASSPLYRRSPATVAVFFPSCASLLHKVRSSVLLLLFLNHFQSSFLYKQWNFVSMLYTFSHALSY